MSNFEVHQRLNLRRSLLLVFALFAVLAGLIYGLGVYLGGISSGALTAVAVLVSAGSSGLSWWQSDRLVLAMTGAKIVEAEHAPQLHNVVEEVAIAAGLPKPRVAIVEDPAPNAFATGRDPSRAIVAVTSGLLARMNRDELQAVVAHEMAHIANRDTLVMSVAAATAGVIALIGDLALRLAGGRSRDRGKKGGNGGIVLLIFAILAPIAALLLKAAVSRSREGLADGTAVKYTRNPTALRLALEKLAVDSTVVRARSSSVAHLWIECPLDQTSSLNRLFSTHPPLKDRIAAVWKLEGGVGAPPAIVPASSVMGAEPEIRENDVDWTTGERKSNWRGGYNANDLNDVKQATNAKWVKWAIAIFAVLFLGPVLLIKITELINSITNALPG